MFTKRILKFGAILVLGLALPLSGNAFGARSDRLPLPEKTERVEKTTEAQPEYSMWVGEVDLRGKKRIWLELIDEHGEVFYESEVVPNVSHVLPGGRMIVVRRTSTGEFIASDKNINDRITASFDAVTTWKSVRDAEGILTVSYTRPAEAKAKAENELMTIKRFGQMVWQNVADFFQATARTIQTAWASVVDVFVA